ncbi:MAG: hypothetical protein ACR2QK_00360 [Acidimicrobiales bacterium]
MPESSWERPLEPDDEPDHIARSNVEATITALSPHRGSVGRSVSAGAVELRSAVHDLHTGRLKPVVRNEPTTPIPAEAR